MTYNILVEENGGNSFQATVLGLSDCRAVAATGEQALAKLREALAQRLAKAEIVEVEVPQQARRKEHSWKRFAGMFENDPLFEEVLEDIAAQRREDDLADPV
jgi:predicted RNase H-like HicB family nuclease